MVGASGEADLVEPEAGFLEGFGARTPRASKGMADVSSAVNSGRSVELPDVAHVAVAELGGLAGGEMAEIGVGEPDLTRRGAVERGEEMEEELLPVPLSPTMATISLGDGEVEVAEEDDFAARAAFELAEAIAG